MEAQPRITMKLDRVLTKREKAKLAATKAGKAALRKIKEVSAKHGPGVKRAAGTVARELGTAAWGIFKQTKAGKRISKKISKGKREFGRRKGMHKVCRWVKD